MQSVNNDGRCTANQQITAVAFNKHFTTVHDVINADINANYCLTKTSVNNQHKLSFFFETCIPKFVP